MNIRPAVARRATLAAAAIAAVAASASLWIAATSDGQRMARGEYLVTISGCNDCHTPRKMGSRGPEPDMSRRLSGHPEQLAMPPIPPLVEPWKWAGAGTNTAFAGPWGVSYASNLTPDKNTGLGIWTEEMFKNVARTGHHWGSARPILPPMPWQNLGAMTDEDLTAVFTYLRTLTPIANRVPEAVIAPTPPSGGK